MSRAPSASFAQFFPTAPRAAKDKAKEREKVKIISSDSPIIRTATDTKTYMPKFSVDDAPSHYGEGGTADIAGSGHDEGDILNGVGSASSHSSTVSSVFSSAAQQNQLSAAGSNHLNMTPLTNIGSSPNHVASPSQHKSAAPDSSFNGSSSEKPHTPHDIPLSDHTAKADTLLADPRVYARAPNRCVKGSAITYDPLLDKKLSSKDMKKAKPIYKDIGLEEDDAPPADPRLAKRGGKLDYINVDFHNPQSRLRHAPYLLRPYAYDLKTSLGPGPPTQVVVTGFDPLHNFSNVSAIFSSFGEIAESSNKLHPDNGSCLGFATFRYRDSRIIKGGRFVSAIEAAKIAVRKGSSMRIGSSNVKVEFDSEGNKSRRMMEALLKAPKPEPLPQIAKATPTPVGKPADAAKFSGPPPTAPKGPASSRPVYRPPMQTAAPTTIIAPTKPKPMRVMPSIEPVSQTLMHQPYIFVSGESVPCMNTTPPHMLKRMRHFNPEDVKMDSFGYYIIFPPSDFGRSDCEKCCRTLDRTLMFNYTMVMKPYLYGTSGSRSAAFKVAPSQKRSRSPAPGDHKEWDRQADLARKREEAADVEVERKERAMNFDPAREAIEVVRKQLKIQLLKNIREKTAAPALHNFLDPANHIAKRRKLGIADPKDMKLHHIYEDDEREDSFSVGTPNSRTESTDRRVMGPGRMNISAMPRIRKAKNGGKSTFGFADPFARARPKPKKLVRGLAQFYIQSDGESEDETRSGGRDTEEPESRSRSRMTSEEEDDAYDVFQRSRDVGVADDDSMSEASFVVGDNAPTKKRKLDLQVEAALKRQKKSDEELFGVSRDKIDEELPLSAGTIDEEMPDVESILSDNLDAQASLAESRRKLAGKGKKKKSKRQIFEEREALKKEQEGAYLDTFERQESEMPEEDDDEEFVTETAPVETTVEWGMSAEIPRPTVDDDFNTVLDLDGIQNLIKDDEDIPAAVSILKSVGNPKPGWAKPWAWRQEDIKALNRDGYRGLVTTDITIGGYYVPNASGCARTEGTKKILNAEKSKYLPHRIRVLKAREQREALLSRTGQSSAADAAQAAKVAAEKLASKGNSRANRLSQRTMAMDLDRQKKSLGTDVDNVISFNQLKKRKKMVKFARSAIHNWGLYAMEDITMNDMIIEYVGEKVRQQVADLREHRYLKSGIGSSYLFRIDENTVVDATKKGGIARFINHSCMPNCTAKIITVDKSKRIVIYALRDIDENEELTYDYKFEREIGSTDRIPCLCGTTACKGFLN